MRERSRGNFDEIAQCRRGVFAKIRFAHFRGKKKVSAERLHQPLRRSKAQMKRGIRVRGNADFFAVKRKQRAFFLRRNFDVGIEEQRRDIIPTGADAHALKIDETRRFVFPQNILRLAIAVHELRREREQFFRERGELRLERTTFPRGKRNAQTFVERVFQKIFAFPRVIFAVETVAHNRRSRVEIFEPARMERCQPGERGAISAGTRGSTVAHERPKIRRAEIFHHEHAFFGKIRQNRRRGNADFFQKFRDSGVVSIFFFRVVVKTKNGGNAAKFGAKKPTRSAALFQFGICEIERRAKSERFTIFQKKFFRRVHGSDFFLRERGTFQWRQPCPAQKLERGRFRRAHLGAIAFFDIVEPGEVQPTVHEIEQQFVGGRRAQLARHALRLIDAHANFPGKRGIAIVGSGNAGGIFSRTRSGKNLVSRERNDVRLRRIAEKFFVHAANFVIAEKRDGQRSRGKIPRRVPAQKIQNFGNFGFIDGKIFPSAKRFDRRRHFFNLRVQSNFLTMRTFVRCSTGTGPADCTPPASLGYSTREWNVVSTESTRLRRIAEICEIVIGHSSNSPS